jgi:hypothetical protein
MATEQRKAEIEIAIFREFVNQTGLAIEPKSTIKCSPPEPDILCLHEEEGYVAFELMEICDSGLAKAIAKEGEGSFLWTSDPTPKVLKKKLSRQYRTNYPVELLLYTNGRVVTPDNVIIPTIKRMIGRSENQFRRVWFLGRKGVHLVCDLKLT